MCSIGAVDEPSPALEMVSALSLEEGGDVLFSNLNWVNSFAHREGI